MKLLLRFFGLLFNSFWSNIMKLLLYHNKTLTIIFTHAMRLLTVCVVSIQYNDNNLFKYQSFVSSCTSARRVDELFFEQTKKS